MCYRMAHRIAFILSLFQYLDVWPSRCARALPLGFYLVRQRFVPVSLASDLSYRDDCPNRKRLSNTLRVDRTLRRRLSTSQGSVHLHAQVIRLENYFLHTKTSLLSTSVVAVHAWNVSKRKEDFATLRSSRKQVVSSRIFFINIQLWTPCLNPTMLPKNVS